MIDLRSDTVTAPAAEMRAAMAAAPVGDDVIDADPTVARLQEKIAELLGKECALFMPSGTMTNQVAVRLHCQSGDEVICEEGCHIFNYEQGGFAQLSQVVAHTIAGRDGIIALEQLTGFVRPDNEHAVRTRLLTLENTHNRAGGVILPIDNVRPACASGQETTDCELISTEHACSTPSSPPAFRPINGQKILIRSAFVSAKGSARRSAQHWSGQDRTGADASPPKTLRRRNAAIGHHCRRSLVRIGKQHPSTVRRSSKRPNHRRGDSVEQLAATTAGPRRYQHRHF